MNPLLVLKCKASYDAFKFEDRHVSLDPSGQTVKVGRSQGQLKPRADNAIFECRVLSRNHAQVWFESERYWIKDTGSSNGTFVNQQRVHQEPVNIKTGDVLQFGVDVDNNPKHTYWCVVSQIICGEANYTFQEADWDRGINQYTKANSQSTAAATTRQRQATQQQPIQNGIENTDPEAEKMQHQMFHELMSIQQSVEGKFATVQRVISEINNMQREQWNETLNNDVLLTRIENLERKLQGHSVVDKPDLMAKYQHLVDEKSELETTSKMTLKLMLQEKMEIQNKYDDLKKSLNQSEEENDLTKERLARAENRFAKLIEEEKRLRAELAKREAESLAERERLERKLSQEREKFNVESAARLVVEEASNLADDKVKAIVNALQGEHDSISDFVQNEDLVTKESAREEIDSLERVIKSQASALAVFFDTLPAELELTQLEHVAAFVRDCSGTIDELNLTQERLKETQFEVISAKQEKELTDQKLIETEEKLKNQIVHFDKVINEKELDMLDLSTSLEKSTLAVSTAQEFALTDQKTQIIMFLASLVVILLGIILA